MDFGKLLNRDVLLKIWKKNPRKIIGIICVVILGAVLWGLYGPILKERMIVEIEKLALKAQLYGHLAAVIFLLTFVLKSFFAVLPSVPLIILGGTLFGPIEGFFLSLAGSLLSASFSFFIGKLAGKNFLQKLLGKRAGFLNQQVENYGIRIIAVMRASFLIPFDILSYMAGFTKMRYRDFILGTLFGIVAEVFSLAYLGDNIRHPSARGFYLAILTIIVVVVVPIVYTRLTGKKQPQTLAKDGGER